MLVSEFFNVSISFVEMERPSPKIGPNNGEINIAPITTAVESVFKPTDAIKIEQIRIHAVVPRIEISFFIEFIVAFLSISLLNLNTLFKKINMPLKSPEAFFLMSFSRFSSSKSNLVSNFT